MVQVINFMTCLPQAGLKMGCFENSLLFSNWTYAKMALFDFKSPSPPLVRGIYGIFA